MTTIKSKNNKPLKQTQSSPAKQTKQKKSRCRLSLRSELPQEVQDVMNCAVINFGLPVTPKRVVSKETLEDMRWQLRYGLTDELGPDASVANGSKLHAQWKKGLNKIDALKSLKQIETYLDENDYDIEQFLFFFGLICSTDWEDAVAGLQ